MGGKLDEWRANWRVVLGSVLGISTGWPVFAFGASQFVLPLEAAFGWSRSAQAGVYFAALLTTPLNPFAGRLIDRLGARRVALTCIPLQALIYLLLAAMWGNIAMLYGLMMLANIVGMGTGGMVYVRAVSQSFDRSRGAALAVSRLGISVAAMGLPLGLYAVIQAHGWQAGYATLALLATCVGWPAVWLFLRLPAPASGISSDRSHEARWRELIVNRRVLILFATTALIMGPTVGFLNQMQPLLTGKGIAPGMAAAFGTILAASVFCGTILSGVLIDRIWAPLVGCAFTAAPVAGCALLLGASPGFAAAACAIAAIGLAQGAELDLMGYLIARYFGIANVAAIFGLLSLAMGVSSAIGSLGFAMSFDRFGSYDPALWGALACYATATLLFLTLGPYPREDAAAPAAS